MAADAVKSTLPPAAAASPLPAGGTSSAKGGSKGGVGESKSTITGTAITVSRSVGSSVWSAITWIPRTLNKGFWAVCGWTADKIWGKGRTPAAFVDVEVKGWFGKYIKQISLDAAINEKYLTPEGTTWTAEYAIKNGKCNEDYSASRGWNIIEFDYKGWTGTTHMKMKLRSAINQGYFTIQQAIDNKFITKKQAISGGWLKAEKAEKPAKPAK